DEMLNAILEGLHRWGDVDGVALALISEGTVNPLGNGILQHLPGVEGALKPHLDVKRVYVNNVFQEVPMADWPEALHGVQSLATIPLSTSEIYLGSVLVARQPSNFRVHPDFSESEIHLLKMIADMAAHALQHATLNEQVKLQAQRQA